MVIAEDRAFVLAATIAITFAVGIAVLPTGWFGDDGVVLEYASRNAASSVQEIFLYSDNVMERYRPLMQWFTTLVYRNYGVETVPIQLPKALAFLAAVGALHRLVKWLTGNPLQAALAVAWFVVLPVKIQALFRPGRPEMFVTAFCLLATVCIYKHKTSVFGEQRRIWLLLSLCAASGASLWSEIGISSFAIVGLWLIAIPQATTSGNQEPSPGLALRRLVLIWPPLLAVALYLCLYILVGAPLSSTEEGSRYSVSFGPQVIANLGVSILLVLSPVATATVARLVYGTPQAADLIVLLVGTVSASGILFICGRQALHDRAASRVASVFVASGFLSLFPFVLVQHVSEVYLAQAAAFFAGAGGILLGSALQRPISRPLLACGLVTVLVMVGSSWNAYSLLRENAARFAVLSEELVRLRKHHGYTQVMLEPPCFSMKFSQYYLSYEDIFTFGDSRTPEVLWAPSCTGPLIDESLQVPTYRILGDGHLSARVDQQGS